MSTVNLPLFKGFDTFAIWPDQHDFSCYGLFSTNTILSPESTGNKVTLPFYPRCKYVAFASRQSEEVIFKIMKHIISNTPGKGWKIYLLQ